MDDSKLKEFAMDILERIDKIDLKSYDFDKDRDMSYTSSI
jgi:hypothetical protein